MNASLAAFGEAKRQAKKTDDGAEDQEMVVGWTEPRRRRTLSPPSKPGPTGELCVSLAAPATIHGSSTATPPSSRCPERAAKPTHTRTHALLSAQRLSLAHSSQQRARAAAPCAWLELSPCQNHKIPSQQRDEPELQNARACLSWLLPSHTPASAVQPVQPVHPVQPAQARCWLAPLWPNSFSPLPPRVPHLLLSINLKGSSSSYTQSYAAIRARGRRLNPFPM
jgi:hypothetical protein